MKKAGFAIILTALLAVIFLSSPCMAQLSAEEILKRADEVRNPQLDYKVEVVVTNKKPEKEDMTVKYEVLVKGRDKTIIKTLEPVADRGTSLLMVNYDLWVFLPNLSQPLRISLQQRLIGEVANGDIARANFSGDYNPKILKTENINGKEHYVLELIAKDERVTYHKVILWAQKDNFHPVKAEFYAVSGRILKTCKYENYKKLAGKLRPTRLLLVDALKPAHQSLIEYDDMKITELPDKWFTKDHLKKIKY